VLVVLMLLAMAAVFFGFALVDGKLPMGAMLVLVAAPGFALLMLSLPVVVARWIPHPPWQTPAMIRLVFLGLVVLMTGVPPLIGEIVSDADDLFLNALNPIVGLINIERQSHDARVAAGEVADRFHAHICGQHCERYGDGLGGQTIGALRAAVVVLGGEPPGEDQRGRHLDHRVEPEAHKAHRTCGDAGRQGDACLADVVGDGHLVQQPGAPNGLRPAEHLCGGHDAARAAACSTASRSPANSARSASA